MSRPVVIFDCDGVLVDSEPLACAVQAQQLARVGLAITGEEVALRYAGMSAADMRRAIERQLGRSLPEDHEAHSAEALKKVFQNELRPVKGMLELLQELDARGVVRGVASSSSPERIELALRLVGFWDFFAPHVFSSSMVARGKPAPDLFLFAARALSADPAACIVVEDSVPGIRAARAAGMTVVGFCGGSHCGPGHGQQLLEVGADHVCRDAAALGALLVSRHEWHRDASLSATREPRP
jgi:HAD superfamily hydrolase (TIGR01509 family)